MGAQNFNLPLDFPKNGVFVAPNFVFSNRLTLGQLSPFLPCHNDTVCSVSDISYGR